MPALTTLLLSLVLSAPGPAAPDVAVVCPATLEAALKPWLDYRTGQGHHIALLRAENSPEQIRSEIRKLAEQGSLKYVLLVGDADGALYADPTVRARSVPAHYEVAKINVKWGSESHLPTDNWYADLDSDGRPELALGRLTADTPQELAIIVRKILLYEQTASYGQWRRKVNFVAGVGGFGRLADAVLESTTRSLIAGNLPTAYDSSMTYASWQSPYCPHPRSFHETTVSRLNEGCLFWVYIGHGHYRTLDQMRGPEGQHKILTAEDIAQLRCATGNPIAFFMACYTGAYDAPQDCLAEEMLRTPGAPVAILSGSRVTMPYAMAVLGTELINQVFVQQAETLGEAVLGAKRAMLIPAVEVQATLASTAHHATPEQKALTEKASFTRKTLDLLAATISPAPEELEAERREHVQMFNLFGDPLLQLRHGAEVKLLPLANVEAGQSLVVQGNSPLGGRCVVELVAPRGALTFEPAEREQYQASGPAIAALNADYQQANNRRWVAQETNIQPGPFRISLTVPAAAQGASHVCVFVEGADNFALGSADVAIRQPRK